MNQGIRPLDGVRVLELGHIIAGPFCTSLLGDMGAEVIKIEPPGIGDTARRFDNIFPGSDSAYFQGLNRNKRSVALNLKVDEGRRIFIDLCRGANVVVENYRVGVAERLGVGYDAVREVNPALIYVSLSAFGQTGPLSHRPGMDILVQAVSGIMGLTGEPGRAPVKVGTPIADFVGSYLACYAIMLALRVQEQHGLGQKIELSLLDGQILSLSNYVVGFFATGKPDEPVGRGHPQLVPYQIFEAKDTYLVVACLTEDFWRNLCRALELEKLAVDARFRTNHDRVQHRDELVPILEQIFIRRTAAEWSELLDRFDVPCAPVNSLADILRDPQVQASGMVVELEHPSAGLIHIAGNPIRLSRTPAGPYRPPPLLGEHTREVLAKLGYGEEDFARLGAEGVI